MLDAVDLAEVRTRRADLASQLEGIRTLEHVLDWMKRDRHSLASLEMITQDEYCHDLLLPVGPDWLVFGMT
jgi:hypothetical protein